MKSSCASIIHINYFITTILFHGDTDDCGDNGDGCNNDDSDDSERNYYDGLSVAIYSCL